MYVLVQELGRVHEEVQGSSVGLHRQAAAAGDRQEHVMMFGCVCGWTVSERRLGWDGMGWDGMGDDIIDAQSFFLKGYTIDASCTYSFTIVFINIVKKVF